MFWLGYFCGLIVFPAILMAYGHWAEKRDEEWRRREAAERWRRQNEYMNRGGR